MENLSSAQNPPLPSNKVELLQRIHREWVVLQCFLQPLTESQYLHTNPGQWSIKDNLAHIAFWEKFLFRHHLHKQPADLVLQIDPTLLLTLDENQLNAIIRERSLQRSLTDVLNDLNQTHAAVMAELVTIEFEALQQPDRIKTLIERPLLESVVCNTYEHYMEHLKMMRREMSNLHSLSQLNS
jgi:hypothetical protein